MKDYLKPYSQPGVTDEVLWIDEMPLWSAPFGLKLLEIVRMKRGISALDIGFGFGFPLIEIAARLGSDSRVVGIDPWDLGIKKTQEKLDLLGLKNVELIRGVAESIPLPDGTMDLITSNNGINNVTDIPKSLRECFRVARPGAQFVFTMNADTTMMEFYSALEQVLNENHMQAEVSAMKNHIYEKRKPATEIREWLIQTGFAVHRMLVDSFVFRYADGAAMLNHYFIRSGFLPAWVKLVPHDRLELVFDGVERRLNAAAKKQGELLMTVPFLTFDCEK